MSAKMETSTAALFFFLIAVGWATMEVNAAEAPARRDLSRITCMDLSKIPRENLRKILGELSPQELNEFTATTLQAYEKEHVSPEAAPQALEALEALDKEEGLQEKERQVLRQVLLRSMRETPPPQMAQAKHQIREKWIVPGLLCFSFFLMVSLLLLFWNLKKQRKTSKTKVSYTHDLCTISNLPSSSE